MITATEDSNRTGRKGEMDEATGRNIQEEKAGQWKTKHVWKAFSGASQSHN